LADADAAHIEPNNHRTQTNRPDPETWEGSAQGLEFAKEKPQKIQVADQLNTRLDNPPFFSRCGNRDGYPELSVEDPSAAHGI